jgi:hypothetical protein
MTKHMVRAAPGLWALAAVAAAALACCTDLGAVREFAEQSAEVTRYKAVPADLAATLVRKGRLSDPAYDPDGDPVLAERRALMDEVGAAQEVLTAYMRALGDLASDTLVDYGEGVRSVADVLATAEAIDPDTASAAQRVAAVVVNAAANGWRQAQLRAIVRDTNADVQTVIGGLRTILTDAGTLAYTGEAAAIEDYFNEPLAATGATPGRNPAAALLNLERIERLDALAARRALLDEYTALLGKVAAGHDVLAKAGDALSKKETLARVHAIAVDLHEVIRGLEDLRTR